MRRCRRCGWDLPASAFSPEPRRKDGLRPWCKVCNAAYVSSTTDPEKRRASDRARRAQRNERLKRRRATDPAWRAAENARSRQRHALRTSGMPLQRLGDEEGWTCYLCGLGVSIEEAEAEHIVAVVNGGTSMRENVALAHISCNRRKHGRWIEDLDWAIPTALERQAVALRALAEHYPQAIRA